MPGALACSPDGAKRNPGQRRDWMLIEGYRVASGVPDYASLHPGYEPADYAFRLPLFSISDAATTASATTAMKIVHTALISGFTPSRTSE
jgi:hypothetical protein